MEALERRQVMTGQLLLTAISPPPVAETNFATVSLVDVRDREVSPIFESSLLDTSATNSTEGVTGLAVDRQGRLIASVSQRGSSAVHHASDLPHASELLIREFPNAQTTERFPILLSGMPIGVADLAIDAATNRLFAITSPNSVSLGPGQLIEIDSSTGEARLIGSTGLQGNVSIAIDGNGTLLATTQAHGLAPLVLHEVDLDTAGVLASRIIIDAEPFALTTGLAVATDSNLLYGSESHSGRLFTIDPETGVRSVLLNQSPERGVIGDLAFYSRLGSDDATQLFHADFESGSDGFSINNTGGDIVGMWHRSLGRRNDGMLNHSADHSFYYGQFEGSTGGGHYVQGTHHRGVISSPDVILPADGTSILSFSYLLDTRPELNRDFVTVSIDNGTIVTPVLSRIDGTLPETAGRWVTATYDLSAFAGQTISVDFEFDSGDPVRVDPEGWYLDDIVIVHLNDPAPLTADLVVTKDSDKNQTVPLELITYTITVSNKTGSETDATNVVVRDTLPPEVTFVSTDAVSGFTQTGNEFEFIIDRLAIGQSRTFTIVAEVNALTDVTDIGGEVITMTNSVNATADQPDPDETDNTATEDVDRITPEWVDLDVVKTTTTSKVAPGNRLTYTVTVTNLNHSNMDATNVVVIDTLPANVSIIDSLSSTYVRLNSSQIQWTLADLAKGDSADFTLVVEHDSIDLTSAVDLTNGVTATADQPDPDDSNNRDEVTTPVPTANLSVVKTSDELNPSSGDTIEFTITVVNAADSRDDAVNVVVTDLIPPGFTIVDPATDVIVPVGNYDPATGVWNGFDLPTGETEVLRIRVRVNEGFESEVLTNTATVSSEDPDPNDSDNTSSVRIVPNQFVQFVTPLSVFRSTATVKPGDSQIAASGFVWDDRNGDGFRDPDEPGIDGVVLEFRREANSNQPGTELFAAPQTGSVDVDGNGVIDPLTESGFWFLNKNLLLPDGMYEIEIQRPGDVNLTSGNTEIELTASNDMAIRDFGLSRDFATTPSAGRGTISGFAWADVNQDGVWDAAEQARTGVQIFLDLDDNGIFDPAIEPASFTDDLGRYVFADLATRTYVIRELNINQVAEPDRAPVLVETFPGNETLAASQFHSVDLTAGSVVQGQSGTAGVPNFGANEVSRFVRPADQLEFWLEDYALLDDALMVYQSFSVTNTTAEPFTITGIDKSGIADDGGKYVSYRQVNESGQLIEIAPSIFLEVGASVEFLAFYDPAVRDALGQVTSQRPNWSPANRDPSVHSFVTTEGIHDHLEVTTDKEFVFRVRLLGGSTFDSDVSYDGEVDLADLVVLNDVLVAQPVIVRGQSSRFDPTLDINARDPNGAEDSVAPDTFQSGPAEREISLGDYGPLNVEIIVSIRDPLPIRLP